MNIKDAYIHNGEAILKDIQVSGSKLQKLKAGKDANDAYLTWVDVLDLSSFGASGHNHDDLYLKLAGGTMSGDITFPYEKGLIYNLPTLSSYARSMLLLKAKKTTSDANVSNVFSVGYRVAADGYKYTYIGGGNYDSTDNLRFNADNSITIGTNVVYHAGNLNIGTLMGSTAIGDSDEPVYWSGTAFVKAGAYPTKSSWNYDDVYLKLSGGTLTGDLTIKSNSGDSPKLIFQRGTLTDSLDDWRIFDTGGNLKFQHTTGSTTDWKDYVVFSATAGTVTINGNTVWHAGNDGSGSTLDADLLDGFHAADFRNNIIDLRTSPQTFNPTYLKDIVFISEADYSTLVSNGSITKNSITHTYNSSNWYVIPDKVPEYAETAGSVAWSNVTSKPATATRWPSWSEVTGKPSTFSPSSHTHYATRYKDSRNTAMTPTNAVAVDGLAIDFKTKANGVNAGSGLYCGLVTMDPYSDASGGYPMQMGFNTGADTNNTNELYIRTAKDADTWNEWRTIITSATIGSQSVGSATTATYASNVGAAGTAGTNYVTAAKVIATCNWYDTMTSNTDDANDVIDRWSEIVAFVANFAETPDLATYLQNNYLAIAGNSTSNPMTGTIYIKDKNVLYLHSSNKDLEIWRVSGNNTAFDNNYGFYLKYNGTGDGDNNSLSLWANNQTSTDKEVYRVQQSGVLKFLQTPNVNGTDISLVGHTHSEYVTLSTDQEITGVKIFASEKWKLKANESNEIINKTWGNSTYYKTDDSALVTSLSGIKNAIRFRWYNDYYDIGVIRAGSQASYGFGIGIENSDNTHVLDLFRVTSSGAYIIGNTAYHAGNLTINTLMGSTAIGDSDEPVYWSGSAWTTCTAYENASVANADKIDNEHLSQFWKHGRAYSNGRSDRPWIKVATLTETTASKQINSSITLYVAEYYSACSYGILNVRVRAESNASVVSWIHPEWALAVGIDVNNFVVGYSVSGTTFTINLYIKRSGWASYAIRKLEEQSWGSPIDMWTLLDTTCTAAGAENTYAEIPSTETQVVSEICTVVNKLSWDNITNKPATATGYGYIGTTAVQESSAAQNLTGINDSTFSGVMNITGKQDNYTQGIRIHDAAASGTHAISSIWFRAGAATGFTAGMQGITADSTGMRFRLAASASGTTPTDYLTIAYGGAVTVASKFTASSSVYFTGLTEGTSDPTDSTEILTSYASNNGFADTTGAGQVYRRKASTLYNYIKGKADSRYVLLSSTEQTIESTISSFSKGIVEFYRSSGDHIAFITFSNKANNAKRVLGSIGFYSGGVGKLQYRSADAKFYDIVNGSNITTYVACASSTVTLSTSEQTLLTVKSGESGSLSSSTIKVKLPATSPYSYSFDDITSKPTWITWEETSSTATYSLSNATWTQTITLPTTAGSYILKLVSGNSTLTGVFSIGASDNAKDEISLHLHGNGPRLYARTNGTKLELSRNIATATNTSVTITYRRMI